LGDHDPSGIDMSRDIEERVTMFMDGNGPLIFVRIALNMPQIEEYSPPPNPAKVTDSRFAKYQEEHGDESWELDALDPTVIDAIIREKILGYRDEQKYDEQKAEEDMHKSNLRKAADRWNEEVTKLLAEIEDPAAEDEQPEDEDETDEAEGEDEET